ncbi:MAG: hypothetical protein IJK50_04190 [Prevotella sp.]|nr:hypothetical protein [Prevotella sp.]
MGKYKLTVGSISDIKAEDNTVVAIGSVEYNVSIDKLDYQKRIFAPGYIHVKLDLTKVSKTDNSGGTDGSSGSGSSGDTDSSSEFPSFSALQEKFSRQLVTLVYNNDTEDLKVAENYFVYKMKPIQKKSSAATSLYVELFCYSMDKLATIDKYCYAYTARKLGGEIFTEGIKKFILTPNPAQLQGKVNLQFLNYKNKDNTVEIRQPYLVQYNESFYDFLARSAIRCGEMLYFEGGSLNLGMKPDLEKASKDQAGVADSVDYEESVDHVLDVEGCHYDFTMRSSENDNRYVDSPTSLLGEYKPKDDPTTTSKVENGLVTETTIYNYEKGKKTVIVETSYYNSDDKEVVKLNGEISKVVTTTTITNSENEELWKLTETVVYEYEKEKDTDDKVAKDTDGSTKYKKQDGKHVSTSKTTKVLTGQGFKAVYNQPEANDANFVELKKDGYTNFSNESFDYRLMLLNLFYTALNDTSLYDIISDIVWSVAQTAKDAGVAMKKKNDQNNDKNLTLDKDENPDQTDGTTFNLFSTLKSLISDSSLTVNQKGNVVSLLTAAFYSKMRRASQTVSQLLVRLNYGADDQGLCLGDVIKVGGGFYIVIKVELDESGNYIVEAIPPLYKEVGTDQKIQKAIPCPPLMPEIPTVRTAEAQVAFVEDNLDPNRFGRVRVRYPWQPEDGDKSPWVRMATPFATAGGGVIFRPCTGDEVLLNYEDGNIERPYIVGSLQSRYVTDPWLPLPDRVIRSKNGHSITFNDKTDGVDFLIGLSPAASFIRSVIPLYKPLITDQNMVDLTGGINITDRYGLYQINMSSDKRSVNIASPLGNVSLNAFTGITISAPNGNVKIEGKNVSISASNKLSLTSGTAVGDHFVNPPDKLNSLGSWANWGLGGLITMGEDVMNRTVCKWLDLSFFRTILEVFTRPVDGTLKIKSNTYVLIEAGKGKAQIPVDNLSHPRREKIKSGDKAGRILGDLTRGIDIYTSKADELCNNIKTAYEKVKASIIEYKNYQGLDNNRQAIVYYNSLGDMKLVNGANGLIKKVFDNRDKSIKDTIKDTDFGFDEIAALAYRVGGPDAKFTAPEKNEEEREDDYNDRVDFAKLLFSIRKENDTNTKKRRDDIVSLARTVGNNLKVLFKAADAWKNFEIGKIEKLDCYHSDALYTSIRALDIYTNFIDNASKGTVPENQSFDDFAKEMTKLRRKIVYQFLIKAKGEADYQKIFKMDDTAEPGDYGSVNDWMSFAEKIKAADYTFSKPNAAAKWARSYFMDGKINNWIDAVSVTNRFRSAEKGRILLSDTTGVTLHIDKNQLAENHAIIDVITTDLSETLKKKVNSVK